ncbi:GntR family transcriptional regulator [Nesterenkonia populi]
MLRIDPASPVRPYEQLRGQIMEQVQNGGLAPGTTLPPVRRLASELGLAPNTVARAYRELETEGYVEGQGRRGTVVVGPPPSSADGRSGKANGDADQLTRDYVAAMSALGYSTEDMIAHITPEGR